MRALRAAFSVVLFAFVVGLVGYYYGVDDILGGLTTLSPLTASFIFICLLANAFAAALRFEVVAAETGNKVGFRGAMAAVGAGSLGSALFFQIAGQLMARGFVVRRIGMPFAAVVVVTLYERIVAAIISGLLAIAGAFYIFGKVYLDQEAGGAELIKIAVSLVAAATFGAMLGYGPVAARAIAPRITQHFVRACLKLVGLTLLVQLPTMAAYVIGAHALSPQISIVDLIAASTVVMFAASIPVSLAGWGVREMSAVLALGTIGVAGSDALTAAVLVGAGSLLAMGIVAAISLPGLKQAVPAADRLEVKAIDYAQALAWILPIMVAVFVLFQIYVPVGSGLLNVNLADPVAILAGSLFVLQALKQRQLPRWRLPFLNLCAAAMTLALAGSLLLGAYRFGWTDWALINRFLGWFVLLAYVTTGALIVSTGGHEASRVMLLTYVGATAAIVLVEIVLVFVRALGFDLPSNLIALGAIEGFAQNRNSFAFQLLMASAAALVVLRGQYLRICLWTLLLAGLWFAGSRSGWIAIAVIAFVGIYLKTASFREITVATIAAVTIVLSFVLLPGLQVVQWLAFQLGSSIHSQSLADVIREISPAVFPDHSSTHERMVSIVGGWKLFMEHPIFGAGLGAFRNELIPTGTGVPLVIHSVPVWLLAELGLVGFLVFAVPGFYVWAAAWRRAHREKAAAVIVLCLVAFAVMSGPADMVYQRTFWLLIGASLTIPASSLSRTKAEIEISDSHADNDAGFSSGSGMIVSGNGTSSVRILS